MRPETRKRLAKAGRKELNTLVRELASLRKENAEWLEAKLKGDAGIGKG